MLTHLLKHALAIAALAASSAAVALAADHPFDMDAYAFDAAKMDPAMTAPVDTLYDEPELVKASLCQPAALDIYFTDTYIHMHSADYIAHGLEIAKSCGDFTVTVRPVVSQSADIKQETTLRKAQMQELGLILKAYNVDYDILGTDVAKAAPNDRQAVIILEFQTAKVS